MKRRSSWALPAALLVAVTGCGGGPGAGDETAASTTTEAGRAENGDDGSEVELPEELDRFPDESVGSVAWRVSERVDQPGAGRLFRAALVGEPEIEDVSGALDELEPSPPPDPDSSINLSPDGASVLVTTRRFGCEDVSCAVVLSGDLSSTDVVDATDGDGSSITILGPPAVADGGELVVVPLGIGPHQLDLFTVTRDGDGWSEPVLVTAGSEHDYNDAPRLTPDGDHVVFDCGPTPYSQEGTGICTVALDGGPVEQLVAAPAPDRSAKTGALEADGSLVFESSAEDFDEVLWRLDTTTGVTTRVEPRFANDNSPCVLPSGWIASLWLRRPGNEHGHHELRLLAPTGEYVMVVENIDVEDVSLACSA